MDVWMTGRLGEGKMVDLNFYANRNRNLNRSYRKLKIWKESVDLFSFVGKKIKCLDKLPFKVKAQIEDSALSVASRYFRRTQQKIS